MHTVATVVMDGVNAFELSVACEVFGLEREELPGAYAFRLCAAGRRARVHPGLDITTPHDLDAVAAADTVIVPAGPEHGEASPAVLDVLRAAHRRGARMVSFCTGAFALAAAGVLDGRRATTHWMHADELRRRFPRVEVDPNVLFVDEGDVLTSAGSAAGIDLSLHIVRLDHGAEAARAVARRMVVPPHRDGGQAQYIDPPHQPRVTADGLAGVLDLILEDLSRDLSVADMARHAAMSERTFARRFKEETGTTPLRWLNTQRVRRAQELLERTDLDVDRVAQQSGLGTAVNLREHFRREVGTTPSAYRRTFRGTRPTAVA